MDELRSCDDDDAILLLLKYSKQRGAEEEMNAQSDYLLCR